MQQSDDVSELVHESREEVSPSTFRATKCPLEVLGVDEDVGVGDFREVVGIGHARCRGRIRVKPSD
jgi:hypothetical protein